MPLRYIYRLLAILIILILLLFGISHLYFYFQERPEAGVLLPSLPAIDNKTRMLVIAPHCDDETLGCGGIIQDVLAAGGQVLVVFMTNGDGFTFATEEQFHRLYLTNSDYIQSGYSRQKEALNALRWLGLNESQIIFLGYPDRGLRPIWTDYWDSSQPYQSRYTGNDHSPYSNSYQKAAPYAGEAVLADLEQISRDFKPTMIFSPHPADEHPDHASTWAFVTTVLLRNDFKMLPQPKLFTYLVHRGDFPIPHGYEPKAALLPPRPLSQDHKQWTIYPLDSEKLALKEQALLEYVSQLRVPIMSSLLYSFIRKNELFDQIAFPVLKQAPTDLDLSSLDAWLNQEPILVNPLGISALGALERRAKIAIIGGTVQNNAIWLRFNIPDFSKKRNEYYVSLVEFRLRDGKLQREKRDFSFSTTDADVPIDNVTRHPDDVIIKIPYFQQALPNYFSIQVLTKDKFGTVINHTVWQPVLVNQ